MERSRGTKMMVVTATQYYNLPASAVKGKVSLLDVNKAKSLFLHYCVATLVLVRLQSWQSYLQRCVDDLALWLDRWKDLLKAKLWWKLYVTLLNNSIFFLSFIIVVQNILFEGVYLWCCRAYHLERCVVNFVVRVAYQNYLLFILVNFFEGVCLGDVQCISFAKDGYSVSQNMDSLKIVSMSIEDHVSIISNTKWVFDGV